MAFGFGTLTNTTPHNSTAPINNPAPSQRLLACGPRPCKTSMSSAPDAPRQVSWLSLRVRSISLGIFYLFLAPRRLQLGVLQLRLASEQRAGATALFESSAPLLSQ